MWRIDLFGGLQGRDDNSLITRFRSSKTGVLLAYLALHVRRSHPRETLIEMLWPETDAGRLSLRVALNALRHQLEPPHVPAGSVLVSEGDTVRLNFAALTTDVEEFETALCSAAQAKSEAEEALALRRAGELYRGDLLAGFYADWILPERERLALLYLQTLGRLGAMRQSAGDLEGAIAYGLCAVAADPLREESHQALIRLDLAAGRPADAVRHYRALERLLKQRLETTPSSATQSLIAPWRKRYNSLAAASPDCSKQTRVLPPSLPLRANLPLTLTRCFGHEVERNAVETLLTPQASIGDHLHTGSGGIRLVTLTGPGGSGKTRQGIEIAKRLCAAYAERVWFVPLAEVNDPARIPDALLQVLHLPSQPNIDPIEQAAMMLGCTPSLLVLDNFEHLVEAGRKWVWQLLEQAPALTCLITSRRRLELEGEREIPIRPLPTPKGSKPESIEGLSAIPSVQMFVDRAQAVRPDFRITSGNAAEVTLLSMQLEGIPLAIEMAAAWAQTLTPAQMVTKMEDRFTLLVSRRQDISVRHRSLHATIEGSFDLLSLTLQQIFVQLSVFHGGWTLEAGETICPAPHALVSLTELRERSLVMAEECGPVMRYSLLETVREFALQMVTEEERRSLQDRHAAYYLKRLEDTAQFVRGPNQVLQRAWTEREYANIVAALEATVGDERGVRLAVALSGFWQLRGRFSEGAAYLEKTLAANTDAPLHLQAKALCSLTAMRIFLGDTARAETAYEEALCLCLRLPDDHTVSEALGLLMNPALLQSIHPAIVERLMTINSNWKDSAITAFLSACEAKCAVVRGEYAAASRLHEQSLTLYRQLEDQQGIACVLRLRGEDAFYRSDYVAACRFSEESLQIYRRIGDQAGQTIVGILGYIAYRQTDYLRAEALMEESLELTTRLGYRSRIASDLWILANVARCRADYPRARNLLGESLRIHRELGDDWGIADGLSTLGAIAVCEGLLPQARAFQEEALAMRRRVADKLDVAMALHRLGDVALREGDLVAAQSLQEESLALCLEMKSRHGTATSLMGQGRIACCRGSLEEAAALLKQSLGLYREVKDRKGIIECLEAMATTYAAQKHAARAVSLYGAAEMQREALGTPLPPSDRNLYQQILTALRRALGETEFACAWANGWAFSSEQSIDYALGGIAIGS